MPLGKNVGFRHKKVKGGTVRLALRNNKVIETKKFKRTKGGKLKPAGKAKRVGGK